jgi:sodium--glutamate symport carrier gltS
LRPQSPAAVPFLERLNVPTALIGGVLVAVVAALLHQFGGTSVQFATRLTDFFLLLFFTTVGLPSRRPKARHGDSKRHDRDQVRRAFLGDFRDEG